MSLPVLIVHFAIGGAREANERVALRASHTRVLDPNQVAGAAAAAQLQGPP